MPVLALKKLVSWVSVTEMFCEVRSESVRAISVTLRSTAMPDENSTVPKNITSITGAMTANSIAITPRRSLYRSSAERRRRSHMGVIGFIALLWSLEGLVLECGGRAQAPLAAAQICDVVAEPGDEYRPLIEQPHHDDIAGTAGAVVVGRHEVLAGVDRVSHADAGKCGIALYVDIDSVGAIEQRNDL